MTTPEEIEAALRDYFRRAGDDEFGHPASSPYVGKVPRSNYLILDGDFDIGHKAIEVAKSLKAANVSSRRQALAEMLLNDNLTEGEVFEALAYDPSVIDALMPIRFSPMTNKSRIVT